VDAETLPVAAEALGSSALEQLPAVVWALDRDTRFTAATGRALTALGVSADEVVGRTLSEVFGTDDPDLLAIAAHAQALAGEVTSYEQNWLGRRFETRLGPRYDERVRSPARSVCPSTLPIGCRSPGRSSRRRRSTAA
jgi:PAS domain S-box-containing protein